MLTCDPPYRSLKGHCVPFMTMLWPKSVGHQLSVTDGSQRPFLLNDHRGLWPIQMVVDYMTKFFVMGSITSPRQIRRGNPMWQINDQTKWSWLNKPSPVLAATWAKPNNSSLLFFLLWSISRLGLALFRSIIDLIHLSDHQIRSYLSGCFFSSFQLYSRSHFRWEILCLDPTLVLYFFNSKNNSNSANKLYFIVCNSQIRYITSRHAQYTSGIQLQKYN
jgi:hypothetical protein